MNESVWMNVLVTLQVLTIVVIVMKAKQLFFDNKGNRQKNLSKVLMEPFKKGQIQETLSLAKQSKEPIARVTEVAINEYLNNGTKETIQEKMDALLVTMTDKLEKGTGRLALLANLATLTGLLGTITGLIHSFAGIANVNPDEKAAILSKGISLAMNTTAYGLVVAVPALIMYAVLQNRASRLTDDLNKAALNVFIQIGCQKGGQ